MRTEKKIKLKEFFSNKWLNYSILLSITLQAILLYTSLGILFDTVPLNIDQLILILPFAFSGLIFFEIWKYIHSMRN